MPAKFYELVSVRMGRTVETFFLKGRKDEKCKNVNNFGCVFGPDGLAGGGQ